MVNKQLIEVIIATQRDIDKAPSSSSSLLLPGVYAVNTGSVGVRQTFLYTGLAFFLIQLLCAFSFRVPPENWKPENSNNNDDITKQETIQKKKVNVSIISLSLDVMHDGKNVHMDEALKTIQFYQLFFILLCNVTAGIGIIAIAKTIMVDVFETQRLVTDSFAAGYVGAISIANLLGRFILSTGSDYLGRKRMFAVFFFVGGIFYLSIPMALRNVKPNEKGSLIWFLIATLINFSFYNCFG